MKWTSQVIYIDTDTGEVLKRYQILNGEYHIITKSKITERNENTGKAIYTIHCKRDGQTRITFGTVHETGDRKHTIHNSH